MFDNKFIVDKTTITFIKTNVKHIDVYLYTDCLPSECCICYDNVHCISINDIINHGVCSYNICVPCINKIHTKTTADIVADVLKCYFNQNLHYKCPFCNGLFIVENLKVLLSMIEDGYFINNPLYDKIDISSLFGYV